MLVIPQFNTDYDGALDLIIAEPTLINIYLGANALNIDSSFCVAGSYSFGFQWNSLLVYALPTNTILV
jgi:hypothetical protein